MSDRSALPSPAALDRAVTYLATTRTDEKPRYGWMDPRWFAADFVALYEQVKDTDPDIREEYGKWAHNAKLWLTESDRKGVNDG